jgi:predicted O-linked N-acetylglucosamine transferase (SPINDLY family)
VNEADARHALAARAAQFGRPEEAVPLLAEADSGDGARAGGDSRQLASTLSRAGNALMRAGQPEAALQCYERSLAAVPDAAEVHNNCGIVLYELSRLEQAIESYDRALRYRPEFAEAHNNRGNALRAMSRAREALACYDAAIRIRPGFAQAHNNRGNVLRELGQPEEALHCYEQALKHAPNFALAASNRGQVLLDLNQPAAALACFEWALRATPNDADTHFGRALALLRLDRATEALAAFEQLRGPGPLETGVLAGRAAALAELQQHAAAAACLQRLWQLAPDYPYALGSQLHSRLRSCDWNGISESIQAVERAVADGRRVAYPQSLLPLCDSPPLQLHCAKVAIADRFAERRPIGLGMTAGAGARLRCQGKIRVAYVSADFDEHPVSHSLVGVLEQHDRNRFEVLGVSLRARRNGAFAQRVAGAFDCLLQVDDCSDEEAARRLADHRVDIAVDLMGFTQGMRLGIFAHRAAPVQINYLGYAGTLGATYIDYIIGDRVVIPPGQERWFTERVVRLPHCYLPTVDRRAGTTPAPRREEAGLPQSGLVLCAFTSLYKINPPVFDIWMRLLLAAPGSVLWLRTGDAAAIENLRREAAVRGIAPDRLIFAPAIESNSAHLARQSIADLYLDTFPYNAHSTACDALAGGVPVLSCAGQSFAARVAASALTAAGAAELITRNPGHYEQLGLELVRDPERLTRLRHRLLGARAGEVPAPLFDTRGYTRGLEAAYQHMWRRSRQRLAPAGFDIE